LVFHDNMIGAPETLLDELTTLVSHAGAVILRECAGELTARSKPDRSPVTAADEASEEVILEGLSRLLPGVPAVSEEACGLNPPARLGETFLLIDPLDGTREIIAGRDEYTINLALVTGGRPVLGIVAAPAQGLVWRGVLDRGAERLSLTPGTPVASARERDTIRTRPWSEAELVAAFSRSHLDAQTQALLARLPLSHRFQCGSAIKFCLLAEGTADIYPRLSPTCEWDVAAGHALLAAAGGIVTAPDRTPLAYGGIEKNFRIPAFLALGDQSAAQTLRLA